jgi:CHAT domain-containing protein/tetratricopeptide (TPR) repeat protein
LTVIPRNRWKVIPCLGVAPTIAALALGASAAGNVNAEQRPGFERCAQIVESEPDSLDGYLCYQATGRGPGKLDEAVVALESFLDADASNDPARLALGMALLYQGRSEGRQHLHDAAAGFARTGNARGEVLARLVLHQHYRLVGLEEQALAELERADAVAQASGNSTLITRVKTAQAIHCHRTNHGRAWRELKSVEASIFPAGPPDLQSTWLTAMANTCIALGRRSEAASYLERHAELLRSTGDLYGLASALYNATWLGEHDDSEKVQRYSEVLAIAEASGNRSAQAHARFSLSELCTGEEALVHARASLEVAEEIAQTAAILQALRALALHLVTDDREEAFATIARALTLAQEHGDLTDVARCEVVRFRMTRKVAGRDEIVRAGYRAFDAIEATRGLQPPGLAQTRSFAAWAPPYRELVHDLLDRARGGDASSSEDVELAFEIGERIRARSLLDELDAAGASPQATDRRCPMCAQVMHDIATVQKRLLDSTLPATERGQLLSRLEELEREQDSLSDELERGKEHAVAPPTITSMTEARQALAADEALLSFQIGETPVSWLTVLTRSTAQVYEIADLPSLEVPIRLFQGLIEGRTGEQSHGARALFDALLAEALSGLPSGVQHLIVAPDGPLHGLPFAALESPSGLPLAYSYGITTVPSVTAWHRWRRSNAAQHLPTRVLVLADPRITDARGSDEVVERAWALEAAPHFGPLPGARAEGRRIARLIGRGSELYVDADASEPLLHELDLSGFAMIHLAAHGVIDRDHPERAAILLSAGDRGDDGLLQYREIIELPLSGQTVVLSACRSATGLVAGAEGMLGLGRAFLQAGATAVVGSLWPVRDDEGRRLLTAFYDHLRHGEPLAAALAKAQCHCADQGLPAAAWAGFVVLGDGSCRPISTRPGRSIAPWLAAVGLLLVLAVLTAVFARRPHSR